MKHNALVRKFITRVIDGSDEDMIYLIRSIIDDMTKKEYGEAVCSPLKEGCSSMMLIETYTDPSTCRSIEYVIDIALPGRCLFTYIR